MVVEHHNGKQEEPPFFLQELQDLTVLDGDEVTLSVKLSGEFGCYYVQPFEVFFFRTAARNTFTWVCGGWVC